MWGDLQGSIVDAATVDSSNYGLGAGYSATFKIPALGPQLVKWAHNGVIFLEPKANTSAILAAVARIPEPGKTVIWKFYRSGTATIPTHAQTAKAMGMKLWIYVDDTESDQVIADTGLVCDAIGIPITATDAKIQACVATGKPVIVHPIRKRSERDRVAALGVKGYMTTCPSYVGNDTARMTTAYGLATGYRGPGDHWSLDTRQGTFDATLGQLILGQGNTGGLSMGSMCPIKDSIAAATQYRISFELKWATLPGTGTTHSDIYFGHTDDSQYQFQSTANTQSGYHAFIRADGTLGLSTHTAGVSSGTSLGTAASATPVADTWMTFEVDVTTTQVIFRRTDNAANVTASNTAFRGGYFGFNAGSTTPAPFIRNVTVIAI
jgi:glycerophosphoryl diester phosphodiesterase